MAKKLTAEDFAALMEKVDDLGHELRAVEGRWPFSLEVPFPDLETHAQSMNRLIENAASAQRMILSGIALAADERRIRKQLGGKSE